MALWSNGGNWSTARPPLSFRDNTRFSDLGQVTGGTTEPAGTSDPAWAGRVIIVTGANTWIKISGVDVRAGDGVLATYEGRRTASPANPAQRIVTAAGPGAPGTNVINDGEIELAINGVNTDLNYVYWTIIQRR